MICGNILCFGDSWAYGAELKDNEKPFVHWVSTSLGLPYRNLGVSGNSLGVIVHDIVENIHLIKEKDIVFVIIPPDSRWYDQNEDGFYPLYVNDDDSRQWIREKTVEWFTYHHSVFIYLIQKILNDINCRYILAHNYGELPKKYDLKIDRSKFLSEKSLLSLLNNENITWNNYSDDLLENNSPGDLHCRGKFFEGCFNHPNELGHKAIAKMLLHKLNKTYFS